MTNPVMAYAWGSRDGIATLQGRPPADDAEAELWMGAHPQAPSWLVSLDGAGETEALDALIAADPVRVLGADCAERFGPRLPFLLKVISAERPLSLQVHPDAEQAQQGFAAEEAAGIDRAAPQRCYRDPYAKPEMLVALTDFRVLQGFRPAAQAAAALEALGISRLRPLVDALQAGTPTGEVFLRLLDWPVDDRAALVAEVRSADGAPALVATLAADYPADPGVVGVVLLNDFVLRPSQGLYVRPGQIHTYLYGTGVEILGGSDNVIRGGLTHKHVSTAGFRVILDVDAAPPAIVEPAPLASGGEGWPTPRPEFALTRYRVAAPETLASRGPSVLLCLEGVVEISDGDGAVTLGPGESAFAYAGAAVVVSGDGVLVRATSGLTS
jgi:mannose-6-phosphate isomerase